MLIIIGLGNIGREYENTFHNMGFGVIDALASKLGLSLKTAECCAYTALLSRNNEKLVLAKPTTFMNLSGDAVKSLVAKYGATYDEVIVCYDDIDLPRFSLRVRADGSAGTHNGMRDVVQKAGTTAIKRLRVGIGRNDGELKDYVLSKIKSADKDKFQQVFDQAADALAEYIKDGDFARLGRTLNS